MTTGSGTMSLIFLVAAIAIYPSYESSNSLISFHHNSLNKANIETTERNTYYNSTYSYPFIELIDTNNTRRRLVNVPAGFGAPWQFLRGVAAIRTHPSISPFCSGSLVVPPRGINGHFVLTAAHCLYDRNATGTPFEPLATLRVEFGVTNNATTGTAGIVQCTVDWYRVDNDWPITNRPYAHDYAIMKLNCPVAPTRPFKIKNWVNSRKTDQEFGRAGYRGTRTLIAEQHFRWRNSAEQRANKKTLGNVMMSRGITDGGDSGSPVYDNGGNHDQRAVHNGRFYKLRHAVKITRSVRKEIDGMMKGTKGIPSTHVTACSGSTGQVNECWGNCVYANDKPKACYFDEDEIRRYLSPPRFIPCVTGNGKIKHLCGGIKICSKRLPDQQCLSSCTSSAAHNCPADRPNVAVAIVPKHGCKGAKRRYLCGIQQHKGSAIAPCTDGTYNDEKCWSQCGFKRKVCFKSASQVRDYDRSRRKKPCSIADHDNEHQFLCGEVKQCHLKLHKRDYRDKMCYSKCTTGGVQNCPARRPVFAPQTTMPCKRGTKYLCNIQVAINNCAAGDFVSEECWGPCADTKAAKCFSAPLQDRGYSASRRRKTCGAQDEKFQRLCGLMKECGKSDPTKRCLGRCRKNGANSCPNNRPEIVGGGQIVCGTNRFRKICDKRAPPAHVGVSDYDEEYDEEYYEEYSDGNVGDYIDDDIEDYIDDQIYDLLLRVLGLDDN